MGRDKEKWIMRPAIAVTQNVPYPFYAFSVNASELRRIAYVSERTKDNPDEGIERNLNHSRCRKIGEYIKTENAVFPNSIIIALDNNAKFESSDNSKVGVIHIPDKPSQALILDGQHRLYGFDHANGKDMELLIVGFIGIPIDMKAHIFRMINGEQKPVNKSLVYDLLDIDITGADFEEERAHALVKELDRDDSSPFYHNIQMTGKKEEGFISQASMITYLKPFLKKKGTFREDKYAPFNKQYTVLYEYFNAVSDTFPYYWGEVGSILSKTTGISALFRLLKDLLGILEDEGKEPNYQEFRGRLEPLYDLPMDTDTHKLYGGGGAIEFHEMLKEYMGLKDLFRWDEIPGEGLLNLQNLLEVKLGETWVRRASIVKSNDDNTITLSADDDVIKLTLNDKKDKVIIESPSHSDIELRVQEANGILYVYWLKG